jgi:hypothetical protein
MKLPLLLLLVGFWSVSIAADAHGQSAVSCPAPPDTLDCTPTRDCTTAHDDRSCTSCALRNPFGGGCVAPLNDPACEAAKFSQNQVYAVQKATCEAQKAQEKAACEAAKAALNVRMALCAN